MEYRWVFAPLPSDVTAMITDDGEATATVLGAFRHSVIAPIRRKMVAILVMVYGPDGRLADQLVALTLDREFPLERFAQELQYAGFPGDFASDRDLLLHKEFYLEYTVCASKLVQRYFFFTSGVAREWHGAYLRTMAPYLDMIGALTAGFQLGERMLESSDLLNLAEEAGATLEQMFARQLFLNIPAVRFR